MNTTMILFLGPKESPLHYWLVEQGENVIQSELPISLSFLAENKITFIVSYGYRHIISADIIAKFDGAAINLHISLLPWNKGASPNLWSFVDNTPKGVTLHYLDQGVDSGDIIVQKEVVFNTENETLSTSYQKLHHTIVSLFKSHWQDIKNKNCPRIKQQSEGSLHKVKDEQKITHLLSHGWDTPVSQLSE